MPRTITAGQEIGLGTISLTPLPTTGLFYGYISNAEAKGKYVSIDGYVSANPIGSNGYFEVAVPPGTYSALSVEGFYSYAL